MPRARRRDPYSRRHSQAAGARRRGDHVAAEELKSQPREDAGRRALVLAEEERKIADERRREFAERERAAGVELADTLSIATHRVDERLRAWRTTSTARSRASRRTCGELEQRQKQLIADAETRIEAEAAELVSTSDEQRASVIRLREELERSAQSAVSEALEELEAHTASGDG